MTKDEVRNRIKAIRTTYMAELRKVEKAAKSGVSIDDLYQPTCAWFKDADRFLRHIVSLRPVFENMSAQSTIQVTGDSSSSASEQSADASAQEVGNEKEGAVDIVPDASTSNAPAKSIATPSTSRNDTTAAAINKLQKICETASEGVQEGEFAIYGKYVANQLRKMNIVRAMGLQARINTLLVNARMEDLNEKHKANATPVSSHQQQTFITEEEKGFCSPLQYTSYSVTSDSQYSYEEQETEQRSLLLEPRSNIITEALNSIM